MSRRGTLLLVAFWLLPALVATLGMRLVPSRLNPDLTLGGVLAIQLALWLPWGGWSLLLLRLGRRFPFERGRLAATLTVHAAAGVVVVGSQILIVSWVAAAAGIAESRGLASTLVIGIRVYGDWLTVVYCGVVAAIAALRWNTAWREQRLQALRLDQDLAQAQLRALQAQLRPHFLFNALNSVVAMIDHDAPAAQRMLVALAELLRATLRAGERQLVPIDDELEVATRYLGIEQIRFADRLQVEWRIEPGLVGEMPALSLQPLVENAIVHGVARRAGPVRLAVAVGRTTEGALRATVVNDGPPPGTAPQPGEGVGLANLRARLERLYGPAAALTLEIAPDGEATATLLIPPDGATRP